MSLVPRYGAAPVIDLPGAGAELLVPVLRQRRRLGAELEGLSSDAWAVESRCGGWSVQDVVAHLCGVNRFWSASIRAGLEGSPTRLLADFDPVETPERLVAATRAKEPATILEDYVSTTEDLAALLESLDEQGWQARAEAPPGDLPVRLLACHALWDAWVHERDILLPLGHPTPREDDEVLASLWYVAALVAAAAVLQAAPITGTFRVESIDPPSCCTLDVANGVVAATFGWPAGAVPVLRGDAVALVESLSMRSAFAEPPPDDWQRLIAPFASVFSRPRASASRRPAPK